MTSNRQRGFIFDKIIGVIASVFLLYLFWKIILLGFLGLVFDGESGGKNKLEVDPAAGGTVIGFFNGVLVPYKNAVSHRDKLQSHFGDKTPSGKPLQYQLFYNDSYGIMLDLVEAYYQRAGQIGLGDRYDPFWGLLSGDRRDIDRVAGIGGAGVVAGLAGMFFAGTTDYLKALSKSKEIKTSAEHRKLIEQLTGKKSKQSLLFVAHSQGNLYALPALNHAAMRGGQASIVHVAPPTDFLKGSYILYDGDKIINGMRKLASHVPPPNINLMSCSGGCVDTFGHGFVDVYFKPGTAAGDETDQAIRAVIDR